MAFPDGGGKPIVSRSRYPAIDIMRGLALISMASSHIMHYQLTSVTGKVFHAALWVDGAFFFVAMSGVVVGLVHRRIIQRSGLRASVEKLIRRAGFLYLVHIALTLTSVVAGWVDDDNIIAGAPPWTGIGDVPRVVARVLRLRLSPGENGVLPLYVVFMLLAVPAVLLLSRGYWRVVVAASLALYCGGWLIGGISFLPDDFSLTAWQALFMGGLLVGWSWEHERLQLSGDLRRRIVVVASVGAVGFLALALFAPGHSGRLFGRLLDKLAGGPVAFLYAGLLMVAAYALINRVLTRRWVAALMSPIRVLGSKGLPGYAALQLVGVGLDLFPHAPRNDAVLLAVIAVCGLTEYGAVKLQERRKGSPGGGVPSDIAGDEPVDRPRSEERVPHAGTERQALGLGGPAVRGNSP